MNGYPPSIELAKGFLSQYANRKPRTLARYSATIKGFMKWYGEPMDDFKVKIPKTLPPYTEESDVEKFFQAIKNKKSHKGTIVRDSLLAEVALKTGMRRAELGNLEPKDIHPDFLVVRNGRRYKITSLGFFLPRAWYLLRLVLIVDSRLLEVGDTPSPIKASI